MMAAAWETDPTDSKPQRPTAIPAEVFHAHLVGRLPAGHPSLRSAKYVPDFVVKIVSDVPLPDSDVPLVGVLFRDTSVKALTMAGAKLQWDFGDGQTSALPNADHVYLRPGLYAVKLSARRGGKTLEVTNRINVDRPHLSAKDKLYSLDDYLKIIETYDPQTLDAASLYQLVLALETKAATLASRAEEAALRAKVVEEDPNRRRGAQGRDGGRKGRAEQTTGGIRRILGQSGGGGQGGFCRRVGRQRRRGPVETGPTDRPHGTRSVGRLGDGVPDLARAAGRIASPELKAQCETAAADVAINDLLKPAEAKPLLDSAAKRVGANQMGPIPAQLERVWGDYYAATGDGKAAHKAYVEAEQFGGAARPFIENTAVRGAHARSTEEFIKDRQFGRAAVELQAWQREFPLEKVDGYLTLLYARYWHDRGKFAQAIAQSEQLLAVNPDSPYVDQLLLVAADSEMRRDRKDRGVGHAARAVERLSRQPAGAAGEEKYRGVGEVKFSRRVHAATEPTRTGVWHPMSTWLDTETKALLQQVPPEKLAPPDTGKFTLVILHKKQAASADHVRAY